MYTGAICSEEVVDCEDGFQDVSILRKLIRGHGRAHVVVPGTFLRIHHRAVLPCMTCSEANEACRPWFVDYAAVGPTGLICWTFSGVGPPALRCISITIWFFHRWDRVPVAGSDKKKSLIEFR